MIGANHGCAETSERFRGALQCVLEQTRGPIQANPMGRRMCHETLPGYIVVLALAALAMANGSAAAAWNNVFQVCCHSCRSSNYVAAPAAVAAPAPCGGCQQCTTRYVQRCYYQPVTSYRQSCYMEPVTTYRTSYYYEPCTSYRYSCYYDPCTCRYQQVAQPVTTYRLRSRCCPVTSYLQRCCLQPVTTYQQMTYYEPQTTCCTTTIGAPVAAPPASAAPPVPPAVQGAPYGPSTQPGPGRTDGAGFRRLSREAQWPNRRPPRRDNLMFLRRASAAATSRCPPNKAEPHR